MFVAQVSPRGLPVKHPEKSPHVAVAGLAKSDEQFMVPPSPFCAQ